MSEERLSKTTIELKRTIELLHEESERYVKIESIKKSLEVEVKNLNIRIENIEANALASTKRMVSKLEARVRVQDQVSRRWYFGGEGGGIFGGKGFLKGTSRRRWYFRGQG
ncbi:Paramyosin, short form [Portunus trituberculatus]|uniref:Paramyosin, short form n=1 Tax=Portunus trituberculatus TaxID=210409 RepID=A0A5B7K0Y1_PORTR|nr:Paramyosin, short form [Portunus trituberculatus]